VARFQPVLISLTYGGLYLHPRDEDPRLRAMMSSGLTAGSTDMQLELRRLKMEERRMTINLEARKLESEKRRLAVEAEERRREQELEAAERQRQHDFDMRRLELQAKSGLQVAGDHRLQTPAFRIDTAIKLIPKFNEHDIESFLLPFEKIAQLNAFPEDKYVATVEAHLIGKALSLHRVVRRGLSELQNTESCFADYVCRCTIDLLEKTVNRAV